MDRRGLSIIVDSASVLAKQNTGKRDFLVLTTSAEGIRHLKAVTLNPHTRKMRPSCEFDGDAWGRMKATPHALDTIVLLAAALTEATKQVCATMHEMQPSSQFTRSG